MNLYPQDTAAPPALFTAAELRQHCRVDTADDDTYLLAAASAAQLYVEQVTSRRLTARTMVASAESWDDFRIIAAPVTAITQISYTAADGAPAVLASTDYVNRTLFELPNIRLASGVTAPELGDDPLNRIGCAWHIRRPPWNKTGLLRNSSGRIRLR
jgi:uncharacterized phiE125 gp8 family phage protein